MVLNSNRNPNSQSPPDHYDYTDLFPCNSKGSTQAHVRQTGKRGGHTLVHNLTASNHLPAFLRPVIDEQSTRSTASWFVTGEACDYLNTSQLSRYPLRLLSSRSFTSSFKPTNMSNERKLSHRASSAGRDQFPARSPLPLSRDQGSRGTMTRAPCPFPRTTDQEAKNQSLL